jgi:hypothetical protein
MEMLDPESTSYLNYRIFTGNNVGQTELQLTGEHRMGCIAYQDKSVLVPLGNRSSGDQLPKLDISGLPEVGLLAPCDN